MSQSALLSYKKPGVPVWLVLVMGVAAVSTSSIFVRNAQAQAPSLVVAAWRLSLAALLLAPFAYKSGRQEYARLHRREFALALLSGVFLAIHFAAWIISLEFTSVASSVVLVTTTPIWVSLAAAFLLNDKLIPLAVGGLVISMVGAVLVGISDACTLADARLVCPSIGEFINGRALWGDFLALSGAWMAAGYVLIGRRLRPLLSLTSYIFLVYGISALILTLVVLTTGMHLFGYSSDVYIWLGLLALVPQLLGHSSFNWALKYSSASFVSIILIGEPIGSTVLAFFVLGEAPTLLRIFGAILILAGILAASLGEAKKH